MPQCLSAASASDSGNRRGNGVVGGGLYGGEMRPIADLQRRVAPFEVISDFTPSGDQPTAITDLIPQNQEMVLECRIALDPDQKTPFVNQKVRVRLGGN